MRTAKRQFAPKLPLIPFLFPPGKMRMHKSDYIKYLHFLEGMALTIRERLSMTDEEKIAERQRREWDQELDDIIDLKKLRATGQVRGCAWRPVGRAVELWNEWGSLVAKLLLLRVFRWDDFRMSTRAMVVRRELTRSGMIAQREPKRRKIIA